MKKKLYLDSFADKLSAGYLQGRAEIPQDVVRKRA